MGIIVFIVGLIALSMVIGFYLLVWAFIALLFVCVFVGSIGFIIVIELTGSRDLAFLVAYGICIVPCYYFFKYFLGVGKIKRNKK